MMLDTKLIDELPKPWFKDISGDSGVRKIADDFYLCWQLNKLGYKVLVDKDIGCGHYANVRVTPQNRHVMSQAWRAAMDKTTRKP